MQDEPANYKARFGVRLRQLRSAKGLSQEALAERAVLDRTYISGCERGKRNVSLINIYRLAEALDIEPSRFFDDVSEPLAGGKG